MTIITKLLSMLPNEVIERLYYSKFQNLFVSIYDILHRNENLKTYRIFEDLLIDIDLSKPGERAIAFNAYEPVLSRKVLNIINDGDVVFDVGSWIGYYTLLAARKAETVISIEPDNINYDRLKKNVQLNDFSNVTALNLAVGDKRSESVLVKGLGSSTNKIDPQGFGEIVKIETLDNIIDELKINEINVLIIDVEGYEYFALKGLIRSLSKKAIKNIFCEVHPEYLRENGVNEENVIDLLSGSQYDTTILEKKFSRPYHIHAKPIQ
jgi:FkbM family methyltransferase